MDDGGVALERLQALKEVAEGLVSGEDAHAALSRALEAVLQLQQEGGWAGIESDELSAVALTRQLGDIIKEHPAGLGVRAAAVYAGLLSLADAPVGTLCDPYAFSGFLHCLKRACLPVGGGSAKAGQDGQGTQRATQGGEEPDVEVPVASLCVGCLRDLGAFLSNHSMKGNAEMLSLLLDLLVDVTGSPMKVSGQPQRGGGRKGAGGSAAHGCAAELAFSLLDSAVHARHGSLLQAAAAVLQRLTAVLLGGAPAAKRGGAGATFDRRGAAMDFIRGLIGREPSIKPCIVALLRHLCVRVTDKADCRQLAVSAVLSLVTCIGAPDQRQFCLFLMRLSKTAKVGSRLIAVELAHSLLMNLSSPFVLEGAYKGLVDGSLGPGDEADAPWSAACLAVLLQRANDKAAGVRSKAMGCIAEIVATFSTLIDEARKANNDDEQLRLAGFVPAVCATRHIKLKVQLPAAHRGAAPDAGEGGAGGDEEEEGMDVDQPPEDDQRADFVPPPEAVVTAFLPGSVSMDLSWLLALARSRCKDDKAAVRKSGLQLLESVLRLRSSLAAKQGSAPDAGAPSADDLTVLEDATMDTLVSVRKAALQAVCSLMEYFPLQAAVAQLFARSALPLVRDAETAIQELLLDKIQELLLKRCVAAGGGSGARGRSATAVAAAAEAAEAALPLLAALGDMGRAASSCLCRALGVLAGRKQLGGSQVAAGMQAIISALLEGELLPSATPQRKRQVTEGAWLVLAEVAGQEPAAPDWQFLRRRWQDMRAAGTNHSAGGGVGQEGALLLVTISHSASRFPAGEADELAQGLLQAVLSFHIPCGAIAAHVSALHRLTQRGEGQASSAAGSPLQWSGRVLQAAEEVLCKAVEVRGILDRQLRQRCELAMFTVGEVTLLREAKPGPGLAVKVQALTALRAARMPEGATQASAEGGFSQQEAFLSQAPGEALGAACPQSLCGQAWTCLGKLCMVDEQLAKKCAPLLVQEMCRCPSPVVRNNLLVALSDMVVQFTGLVDTYVGRLAAMVCDPHELIRRQALALMANLLGRDYVKWRGALFHRFLLALVDECASVRAMAQYLLSDALLGSKAPLLAYNHFVEALFSLNDCRAGMYGGRIGASLVDLPMDAASGADGSSRFHLKGSSPLMRAKRDVVYHALARRMAPEHRFAASARLVAEVLGGVVDGLLPLEECNEVLGDAMRLLGSKEMKVNASRFGAGAEDDGGGEIPTGTQEDVAKARGKLVNMMMRKHLIESVVPLLIELRHMLQAAKHPMLGALMACTVAMLRDNKSEVEDILVADKQMAKEILHDMKQYEAMAKQQQQQQQAAMAAAMATGSAAEGLSAAPDAETEAGVPPGSAAAAGRAAGPAGPPRTAGRGPPQRTPLAGVTPGRTPMAAEVLATAAKQRRQALASRNATPAPTPGARGPAARTPGTHLLASGGAALQAMRTPYTAGGSRAPIAPMLSPAPLSKAKVRAPRSVAVGVAALGAAAGGAGPSMAAGGAGAAAMAATAGDAPAQQTVVLPSPNGGDQQPLRQWDVNLHEHDARQRRRKSEALFKAVASAKKVAAEAVGEVANDEDAEMEDGAAQGAAAAQAAAAAAHGGRGAGNAQRAPSRKEQSHAPAPAGRPGRGAGSRGPHAEPQADDNDNEDALDDQNSNSDEDGAPAARRRGGARKLKQRSKAQVAAADLPPTAARSSKRRTER